MMSRRRLVSILNSSTTLSPFISVKEKQPSPAAPMMQITQKVFIVKHGISDINVTKKSNLNRFDA